MVRAQDSKAQVQSNQEMKTNATLHAAPLSLSNGNLSGAGTTPGAATGSGAGGGAVGAAAGGTGELCTRCRKPFLAFADIVYFNQQPQHAYHFTCALCKKEVDRQGKQWDEEMYCSQCYNKVANAICAACGLNITGRSTTAMGLQFHPEVLFLIFSFC